MRVCIISRGDLSLFPPTQGASFKLFYTLKTLSDLGIEVYFITAENDFYYEVEKGKFKKKMYPSVIKNSSVTSLQKKVLLFLGIPSDIHPIYHPLINFRLWLKLFYVAIKEKIDVIQAEFTAFAIPSIFVKLLTGIPICLVEHNVESYQIPKITRIGERGKKLVRFVERTACNLSDRVISITDEEKKRLQTIGVKREKIEVIPYGVDLKEYRVREKRVSKIKRKYKLKFPTLVFHGTYSYKPNYDAVSFLAEKVISYLRKKKIRVKLLAIGDSSPKDIADEDVIFTGVVKDLPAYLKASDIAVVPIKAGGGMRIKILEYFAAKLPVVSTPFGAEGIPVKNEKEIITVKLNNFPKKVEKLIKDKKLRKEIRENAFLFVKEWDWKKIMEKYIEVYRSLTNKIKGKEA